MCPGVGRDAVGLVREPARLIEPAGVREVERVCEQREPAHLVVETVLEGGQVVEPAHLEDVAPPATQQHAGDLTSTLVQRTSTPS
jgi:hypothetical protein